MNPTVPVTLESVVVPPAAAEEDPLELLDVALLEHAAANTPTSAIAITPDSRLGNVLGIVNPSGVGVA